MVTIPNDSRLPEGITRQIRGSESVTSDPLWVSMYSSRLPSVLGTDEAEGLAGLLFYRKVRV